MKDDNQTDEIILEDELNDEPKLSKQAITIIITSLVLVSFLGLSWYAYNKYTDSKIAKEIPIISANNDDIKIKPDDPGGMHIPNTDKSIYDSISGTKNNDLPKVERILPSPEEAIDKKSMLNDEELKVQKNPLPKENKEEFDYQGLNKIVENIDKDNIKEVKKSLNSIKENSSSDKQKSENVDELLTKALEAVKIQEPPKEIKRKFSEEDFKATPIEKSYRIQVGSFRTNKEAVQQWQFKKARINRIIGNIEHHIIKKNVPQKGVMHRLQLGPIENDSTARKLCNKLKESGIDCFLIRPQM